MAQLFQIELGLSWPGTILLHCIAVVDVTVVLRARLGRIRAYDFISAITNDALYDRVLVEFYFVCYLAVLCAIYSCRYCGDNL